MTTIPDITSLEELEKLQRLARGERDQTPLPMGIRITENRGVPNPPPARDDTTMNDLDFLLSRAMKSENGQTRKLAERIQHLISDLQQRIKSEDQARREQLSTEVTQLEMQLAAARAELDTLTRLATTRTSSAPVRSVDAKSAVDAAAIRIWAANNGYNVQPFGRVPKAIIDAWCKATLQTETAEDE